MKDITWTRKQVTLEVASGGAVATLVCNVSVAGNAAVALDEDLLNFVDDALETFLTHTSDIDMILGSEHNECLSGTTQQGHLIGEGFEEGQEVTGCDIMFNSLLVTEFIHRGTGFSSKKLSV